MSRLLEGRAMGTGRVMDECCCWRSSRGRLSVQNLEICCQASILSTSMIIWTLASEHIPRCSCEVIGSGLGSGIFCFWYLQAINNLLAPKSLETAPHPSHCLPL